MSFIGDRERCGCWRECNTVQSLVMIIIEFPGLSALLNHGMHTPLQPKQSIEECNHL